MGSQRVGHDWSDLAHTHNWSHPAKIPPPNDLPRYIFWKYNYWVEGKISSVLTTYHQFKKKRLYWFIDTHFSFRLAIKLCTPAHGVTQQSDRQASAMNGSTTAVYGTVVTAALEPDSIGQGLCPTPEMLMIIFSLVIRSLVNCLSYPSLFLLDWGISAPSHHGCGEGRAGFS